MPKPPKPRGYLQLVVRNTLLQQQLNHHRTKTAESEAQRDRYQQLYLGGVYTVAGLQGECQILEEQLARLEKQSEDGAPVVSGWKVDLDAALVRIAELESLLRQAARPVPLVPSPPAVRAALYRRVTAAAGPADLPARTVPAPQRERNAS